MKLLVLLVVPLLVCGRAWASGGSSPHGSGSEMARELGNETELFTTDSFYDFLPANFLDQSGFQVGGGFAVDGLDASKPVFPMLPMFHSKAFSKINIGAVVPAKYLGLPEGGGGGGMMMATGLRFPGLPKVNEALEQMGRAGLSPVFYNNQVYGFNERVQNIAFVNETTYGISASLDFDSETTVTIGEKKGFDFNILKPLNEIFSYSHFMINGQRAQEVVDTVLSYIPYFQSYLASNKALAGEEASWPEKLPARYNDQVVLPAVENTPRVVLPVDRKAFSKELQNRLVQLQQNLSKEKLWIPKISQINAAQPVYDDVEANELVQEMCDYLASAYEVPKDLWPRCRVAASLQPNAFAYPGGSIFITAGLLGVMSDMDGVLFVLGHEIGHVVGRHSSRKLPAYDAAEFGANVFGIIGNAYALTGGAGSLGQVTFSNFFPQVLGAGEISSIGQKLYGDSAMAALMAHSRDAEWEADRYGHQAALASGADGNTLTASWAEFIGYVKQYFGVPEGFVQKLYSDHPDADDRMKALEDRYGEFNRSLHDYTARNRLPEIYYFRYGKLHSKLAGWSKRYGEMMRDQRAAGSDGSGSEVLRANYAQQSLFSPGGLCIHYSLGGMKN